MNDASDIAPQTAKASSNKAFSFPPLTRRVQHAKDVDGRDKPGHDCGFRAQQLTNG
jgi:hypothetical protein